MNMQNHQDISIFRYWGKADPNYSGESKWHPLVYHSLDVAAVAAAWWDESSVVRRIFLTAFKWPEHQGNQLRAWLLFFIALHDLGKFDVRFQLKALEAIAAAWPEFDPESHGLSAKDVAGFDHGWAGIAWANQEYRQWLDQDDANRETWDEWMPWLLGVTGHHGDYPSPSHIYPAEADMVIINHDRSARHAFVNELASLYLTPVGLGLQDIPPACSSSAQAWLAGFCAVCDWIGSNTDVLAET